MALWKLTFERKALFEQESFHKDGHTAILCTRWKDEAWQTDSEDLAKNTPSEGPYSPDEDGWDLVGQGLTAEYYWEFSDGMPAELQSEIEADEHDIEALFDLGWSSGDMTREVHGPLKVEQVE